MTIKELKRRYRNGTPIETLADLADMNVKSINYALEVSGAKVSKRDHEDVRMRELYDQGLSDLKISRSMGCSSSRVWHWRNRNSLPSNHKDKRGRTED